MFVLMAVPAMTTQIQTRQRNKLAWYSLGFVIVWFVGYRYQVGGDWYAYVRIFESARFFDFGEVLHSSDPGYVFVNWLMRNWGFEVFAVNLVCALVFTIGLVAFARRQPYPWLVMAVAFPYLVTVVAMGYSRQGVAIGLILLALNALEARQFKRHLASIVLATLFHKTALIMIPLGFFIWGRGWFFRSISIVVAAYVLFDALVAPEIEGMWESYVDAQMVSEGARIRVMMNLVPSVILLAFWKNWRQSFPDYWFWFWIAVGSVLCLPLVAFASTAVDRIALYFLPIQLVVFSRLPYMLRYRFDPNVLKFGIVAGYAAVLYVWLNYASHSLWWIPYKNALFQ
jgi:hypothetical protein